MNNGLLFKLTMATETKAYMAVIQINITFYTRTQTKKKYFR